jgi:hypothetical protein
MTGKELPRSNILNGHLQERRWGLREFFKNILECVVLILQIFKILDEYDI